MEREIVIVDVPNLPIGYDKASDKQRVDETGFIDLNAAYAHNTIDGNLNVVEANYNGIEDPASIMGSPKDVFDAANYRQTLSDYKAPSNNPSGEVK